MNTISVQSDLKPGNYSRAWNWFSFDVDLKLPVRGTFKAGYNPFTSALELLII